MFINFKTRIVMASVAVAMVAVIACGSEDEKPAAAPTPGSAVAPTPSGDLPEPVTREVADAPVDNAIIEIRESFPVQYGVTIHSGLPNACYTFDQIIVDRNGDTVNITVTNTRPAPSAEPIACAEIYRMVKNAVTLPGTYDQGTTYTVNVNDMVLTFEGQDPIAEIQTDDRGAMNTADELSDLFQDADVRASRGEEAFQSFFGFSGEAMTVFGERVEVYLFDNLEDAEAAAAGIKPDGSIVGADGSISMVTWVATQHFYVRGDSIMLYVGENLDVIDLLDSIAARLPAEGISGGGIGLLPLPEQIAVGEKFPEDIQSVLSGLESRFGQLGKSGVLSDSIFGVDAKLALAGDAEVQLYEFGDADQAKKASGRVSPDGGTITSADGQSVSSVRWIGPPHFYLRGNLITLYVGDSIEITEVLDSMAGEKFAGPGVVIDEPRELIIPVVGEFKLDAAPVEKVEVMILEKFPPLYIVHVTIGLPSGCHEFNSFTVKHDGKIISIQILNQTPVAASICTLIYGVEEIRIPIEGPFEPGVEFDVLVNGERHGTFVGQG